MLPYQLKSNPGESNLPIFHVTANTSIQADLNSRDGKTENRHLKNSMH